MLTDESTNTGVNPEELKQLEAMEAEQAERFGESEKKETPDTTPPDDRASGVDKTEAKPSSDTEETRSDADKEVTEAKAEAEKEGKELDVDEKGVPKRDAQGKFVKRDKVQAAPAVQLTPDERKKFDAYLAEKQGSKYAKEFNRRLVTWTELNAAKEKFAADTKAEQTKLQGALNKFNADVQAFQAKQAQSTPTPEKYEAFAQKQLDLATVKEAEAVKAEAAGDFDKAEALKDEAKFARRDAQAAKASAEHVRKNPPLNDKQIQEKFVADQKTWVDKAATEFPDFAKKDSALFKDTVAFFKQMTANDPAVAKLPGFIYFCAERAHLKSAAARVPSMEKELGELRTKTKELEALTNPTPQAAVARVHTAGGKSAKDMPLDDLYAQLREEAASMC